MKQKFQLPYLFKFLLFIFFLFSKNNYLKAQTTENISFFVSEKMMQQKVVQLAVDDAIALLKQACNCETSLNNKNATIQLILPEISDAQQSEKSRFEKDVDYPYFHYPNHDYEWISERKNGKIVLTLHTNSYQGISFGVYSLLQERLGFSFYHPKESLTPNWKKWPLAQNFSWQAKAKFDKKGFHLHTQHPIELTEALHNPDFPNALADIKNYIDWLARNQQNYFEFCLLESINHAKWPPHAKAFVDYAHDRGLIASVDLSLHMIQQKSFQLYQTFPKNLKSKKLQIDKNLALLFIADWDILNVEFATAEFIGGNIAQKEKLRLYLIEQLEQYDAKLMGRKHIVKDENEVGKSNTDYVFTTEEEALDKQRGMLIHTVMFYDLTEKHAPVYENENQRHQYDLLLKENEVRETWYYPESAYWVTFDNSLPVTLLPYLSARLSDIDTIYKHDIKGHITFSSGWEWGYWLFDWSIARWSWEHTFNEKTLHNKPTEYLSDIFPNDSLKIFFEEALKMQEHYLKERNLMPYMTSLTVTDEVPSPFNKQFHPRPKYSYRYLRHKATNAEIKEMQQIAIEPLLQFASETNALLQNYYELHEKYLIKTRGKSKKLLSELLYALQITALRAEHRANVLIYLLSKRQAELNHTQVRNNALEHAINLRAEALQIVKNQEENYRYDVENIARKRKGHTAYHFGYLYPVSNLHFWYREEEQARHNKFNPLFLNIWNISRVAGFKD
ncbi:MAG: hypothetical protein ACPG5B_13220 [Chitinophagales bacterium]